MSGNYPKVTIPDHFIMTCSRLLPIISEVPRGISRFYLELDNLLVISSGSKNPEQSSSSSLKYLNIPVLNPMFALFQYFSFLVSKKFQKTFNCKNIFDPQKFFAIYIWYFFFQNILILDGHCFLQLVNLSLEFLFWFIGRVERVAEGLKSAHLERSIIEWSLMILFNVFLSQL